MAERAECVMLNKGVHVVAAVKALDELLPLMEAHQTKKTSRMRALHSWPIDEAKHHAGMTSSNDSVSVD